VLETTISDRKAVNHYKLKRPMRVFVVVDNSPGIEVESILPKCQNMATESDLYLVSSTPTKSNQQIALQVINALALTHSRIFTIDKVNGDQLQTIYSNEHDQRVIQSIANNSLVIAPVTPQGIVAPFQRLHTFGKNPSNIMLQAYIITSGTSDPTALTKIRTAAQNLTKFHCLQVNVIGLDPAHRIKMSEALSPIRSHLRFSGSDQQEWQQLIDE
jgi:hypothetical protein